MQHSKVSAQALQSTLEGAGWQIERIYPLADGYKSQVFGLTSQGQEYVVRVGADKLAYLKDQFVAQNYVSQGIPVPEVLAVESVSESIHYCVSRYVQGQKLNELTEQEFHAALPSVQQVLVNMQKLEMSETIGHGDWQPKDGVPAAEHESWRSYILSVANPELSNTYSEIVDDKTVLQGIEEVRELVKYTSEERSLIHGDFGFGNVLVNQNQVVAVLDWGFSKLGDYLFDVAWLEQYSPGSYGDLKSAYETAGVDTSNYQERIRCYQLWQALQAVSFFASRGDFDNANQRTSVLKAILLK